jgi:hypothetical protein
MITTFRSHLLSNASLGLMALLALVVACAGSAPTPTPTSMPAPSSTPPALVPAGLAPVDSLDVLILESFPVQIHVVVKGQMPDACTFAGEATQERVDDTFKVTLPAQRPADAICAQVLTPYELTLSLDVRDLPKGEYTVDVNGTTATFELTMDNTLNTPTP